MLTPIKITKKEARQLALISQGFNNEKISSLQAIEQISYIQIDTISVTERSHNHVLFTRNPKINLSELDNLMENKSIFEYWSHAAAYLPMKDYSFSLYQKQQYKKGSKHWFPRDKKVEQYVLDRIKSEGSLQSKDFESKEKSRHAWGQWKPAKMAMTNLFMDGDIMIANRKGFQKVFDLTERVVPSEIITAVPTIKEYCKHLINNVVQAHGVVNLQEIVYLRKGIKPIITQLLDEMITNQELSTIKIEGLEAAYYTNNKQLDLLNNQKKKTQKLHILNPFDNLVIQRKRLEELFNFEYLIECYVPEKKRKFGYYTLPILYGETFVARMDAKADRKTNTFNVKGFWFEEEFLPDDRFRQLLDQQLYAFAQFCGCDKIEGVSFKN